MTSETYLSHLMCLYVFLRKLFNPYAIFIDVNGWVLSCDVIDYYALRQILYVLTEDSIVLFLLSIKYD